MPRPYNAFEHLRRGVFFGMQAPAAAILDALLPKATTDETA